MEKDFDFLGRYRAVSNKLKKRFLKKPNVAEGSEQFAHLAKTLHSQECPQYSGFCSLAQARCENTLGNSVGEASCLTIAARHFMEAEKDNASLLCPSPKENLNAAINCYSHAIRVHIENRETSFAANLCVELGNNLRNLGRTTEAIAHYQRAAELHVQNPLDCLTALGLAVTCKIEKRDFEGALAMLTEMTYIIQERGGAADGSLLGAYADIMAECEISRVLLLMLLQPTPQRIRPEHAQTLEKYTWESGEDNLATSYLTDELFILLQSVVMACQWKDVASLRDLQVELWPLLNKGHNHLLHLVVEELGHPSGYGM